MAYKSHVTVAYFRVTSYCRKAGSEVKKIPLGSNDVEHVIKFENGSTLPYDMQALSTHPDIPAEIKFSYRGGALRADWLAQTTQIGSGDVEKDIAKIHSVRTSTSTARIQTPTIEYRLDNSVCWQTDPTYTNLLEIKMDVG
jgi:hypothetical protein